MKIGFIYESSFATKNGANHLLGAILKKMLEEGHEVHLFQSSFDEDISNDYPCEFNCPLFYYHPIKLNIVKKTSYVKRYLNGLKFTKKVYDILKGVDIDMFFVQSSPSISFMIKRLKRKKKPILYNIYDVFPGAAYELGILKSKFLNMILKKIQRIGYKLADKIIVMSEDMKNKLLFEKANEEKIIVVHNWFDEKVSFIDNEQNLFVKENNINTNNLIIQFAGNIGQVFGLEEFSELVVRLKDVKNVEFHIIGEGVKLNKLKENVKDCKNIRFFGWQPQERMNEIYSYCDFEIIPLHKGVIGNNVPSKVALAMACGKPIINILEKSEYYEMFEKYNIGFSFEHNEIEKALDVISYYAEHKSELKIYKEKCIEFTNREYSKKDNLEKIMNCVSDLSKKSLN